jgi:hypothetical protein
LQRVFGNAALPGRRTETLRYKRAAAPTSAGNIDRPKLFVEPGTIPARHQIMEREMNTRSLASALLAATVGLGAIVAGSVAAQPGPGGGGKPGQTLFERYDADGDGKVTQDEFRAGHTQRFNAMDTDGDGKITSQEMQARQGQRMQRMMQRSDTDGDGAISREESQTRANTRFQKLDQNGDKVISRNEIQAMRGRRPGMGGQGMGGQGMGGQGMGGQGPGGQGMGGPGMGAGGGQ